jgi:uroporphyrinogen decarboxylase
VDKRSRIRAAIGGEQTDRVPLSLWRHFHRQDRTADGLAAATLAFAREYDLDLIKLTPSGLYAVEDWAQGYITYPGTEHAAPFLHRAAVQDPEGWGRLPLLAPSAGALGRELEAIRQVVRGSKGEAPLVMTIFSPLTLAYKLSGDTVIRHLREHPNALHRGLEIIAETVVGFADAALKAGADGLFFATQLASHRWVTPAEYAEFGQPYDLAVLAPVTARSALTILHLHGKQVFFDLACDDRYPIHAISWHDRETYPDLDTARRLTNRSFVTGLDRELLGQGPAAAIRAQVHESLSQTKGRGLILAPSCVIPTSAPLESLAAVRDALVS